MFALLLVAVGIAFRVAEEPGVFAQPLSVTTNKMSVLVEARFPTPTSAPPALAAASALRISLKAHKASQQSAAVADALTADTQVPAGEVPATSQPATATLVPATLTPVQATAAPTVPPTAETLPQPTLAPLQPTPTPVSPPATQTPTPSRDAAAASQPAVAPAPAQLPPTRITIPRIGLDVPVRPVGTINYQVAGETRYIWDTLPDTAAFHETSAYPGLPGNTVINGHRDTDAAVFRALGEVQVGDAIHVFVSEAVGYVYQVAEILVVPHTHASQEQHAANRKLLGYFPEVRLTLVTCEPLGSATHRLVIIAKPPAAQQEAATP